MDATTFFMQFQDFLAPKLDAYEQAIYLYLFRHSRLIGRDEAHISLKSECKKMAFGIGEYGKPMAEGTCRKKIASMIKVGCIEVLEINRKGSRIRVHLPDEIVGVIPPPEEPHQVALEEMDFFTVPANRLAILSREGYRCFYCLRGIDSSNFVIEHVVSRPEGNNSFKNLVAACNQCNARKSDTPADEFLRQIYREGFITGPDFHTRMLNLRNLKSGLLRPAA